MIAELTQNLIDLVKSTAGTPFGPNNVRVGLGLGGKDKDPSLVKVPKPAVWIMFIGDQAGPTNTTRPVCAQQMVYTFAVQIIMDYTTESDIIATKLPVLDAVRRSVHAADGVSGSRWTYDGQQQTELTDRLVYEQRYTINATAS